MTRSHIRIHIPIQTYPNTGGSWIPPSYRFLVPPLLLTSSSFPPSFLSSPPAHPPFFPPAHRDGGRGEGVMRGSLGGHIGSWWALLGVIGLSCGFFSARYRPSVHCTWFLPNFVEFGRLLKNDLGDEKIMMPNNQLSSYLFDYWALIFFEYISVSGAERGSFWSKKKFKKLINKDFRAFFLKTVFIFSRPQFSKIWISETGYGSRLIPRYFRKKMGGSIPKMSSQQPF